MTKNPQNENKVINKQDPSYNRVKTPVKNPTQFTVTNNRITGKTSNRHPLSFIAEP